MLLVIWGGIDAAISLRPQSQTETIFVGKLTTCYEHPRNACLLLFSMICVCTLIGYNFSMPCYFLYMIIYACSYMCILSAITC
jgi:hypothetical protein